MDMWIKDSLKQSNGVLLYENKAYIKAISYNLSRYFLLKCYLETEICCFHMKCYRLQLLECQIRMIEGASERWAKT